MHVIQSSRLTLLRRLPHQDGVTDGRILIVDDDVELSEMLASGLKLRGFDAMTVDSGPKALDVLRTSEFDTVVSDLHMQGMDGIELSRKISDIRELPIIMLTGQGSMESAIDALRTGVFNFLLKPVKLDVLELAVRRAVAHHRLHMEVASLREALLQSSGFEEMIGESRQIKDLQSLTGRVAPAHVSVLITGESGTGKELVARALHERSPRAAAPFIAINCAAMPASLLESELFGHVVGAFTDAKKTKRGLFVQAHKGTLFLDEIGDMPLEMQAKLLRALQEQSVRPVGGTEEVEFDVRVVAATHRDLEEEVEEGRFREDLYYRINVVHLPVPPLRSRGRDILLLAQYFVERGAERSSRNVSGISPAAATKLVEYEWPGNVRELENAMERGVALARGDKITLDDLPEKVRKFESTETEPEALGQQLMTVQELERRHIIRVLQAVQHNKTRAAEVLGFDRRTLYRKLERYGIEAKS